MLTLLLAAGIYGSPAYYPEGARRRGEEGVTRVELQVGPSGKPEMCRVVKSSGLNELDASACDMINSTMHYAPHIDPNGVAVRSTREQSVRWQLESDPEEKRQQPARVVLAVIMAAFLTYLPMSLIHAVQSGDFWRFEKAGRFSLLRAAGREQNPGLFWAAVAGRALAFLVLSLGMAQLIGLMAPASVQVSTPAVVDRPF